jgi:hypothetical protein
MGRIGRLGGQEGQAGKKQSQWTHKISGWDEPHAYEGLRSPFIQSSIKNKEHHQQSVRLEYRQSRYREDTKTTKFTKNCMKSSFGFS